MELHGGRTLFPNSTEAEEEAKGPTDPMAEEFVNQQIDHYIGDLESKLGAMKSSVKELEAIHPEASSSAATGDPSTLVRTRELAQNVGDRAGEIYKMVALVLVDVRPKDHLATPPSTSGPDFLVSSLKFLQKQVGKAEGRIKALFLEPTHTVDIDELRGDNVLTELKSIEQVSKEIKKKAAVPEEHSDMVE